MNHPIPPITPDAGHEYPLSPQNNLKHLVVVVPHGTTDKIIKNKRPGDNLNQEPVYQFPGENRKNAIAA